MSSLYSVVDSLKDDVEDEVLPQPYDPAKKRYATYFPDSFPNILACLRNSDDHQSTWNFTPSPSHLLLHAISPEVNPETTEQPESFTPAQRIASSYRKKSLSIVIPPRVDYSLSIDSSEDDTLVDDSEYCSLDYVGQDISDVVPKIRLRQTCSDALTDFKAEAFAEMLRCQLSPEDPLRATFIYMTSSMSGVLSATSVTADTKPTKSSPCILAQVDLCQHPVVPSSRA
ncbi:uncharacterized protein EV420DRAFT_1660214 [Desarmillaria tabescens]|uniref:Uncharacterized protein n=1 Tax=Armillaria tabescens TaxID=1929756 RepID=A0AA39TXW8_ARMTA|nr:uncharacterized protein EV420DRAFT_1660214 [Desarmillaria tabescens]KAK0469543.1 hypothetical protein EV420DRAFT_1660214 [Desarmillaria tabescens]